MNITLEQITDYISKFVDYINSLKKKKKKKEFVIQKLEEAVFWLTYLNNEEVEDEKESI